MENQKPKINVSKTSNDSDYSLGRALNFCYEYDNYTNSLQARVDRLKAKKQEEVFTALINEIKNKMPEKFKKFFELNFSFDLQYNPNDPKHNLFKMIRDHMYGFIGITLYRIETISIKNSGFVNLEDFLNSLSLLNDSLDGVFKVGCHQSDMSKEEIKRMQMISLSFWLDKPDYIREMNRKSMDDLFNAQEKLSKKS
ncbi:MAG: hypothetical protein WC089_00210 [Candidatus Paceibacterota bacterium]